MKDASTSKHAQNTSAFALVFAAFALFGLVYGVWLVLLADLQQALGLSPGALGLALTAGLLASLPALLIGGRLADRFGAKALLSVASCLIAVALMGIALAQHYAALLAVLLLFFAATGAFDVAINAAAILVEQASGRKILPYFHAAFSGLAAASALMVGAALLLGVPFRLLYVVTALIALGFGVASLFSRQLPSSPTDKVERSAPPPSRLYRHPTLLLLAFITALAFMAEGELGNWSAIYLRSSLELPALLGASGVAVFHSAMLVGRLGTGVAVRFLSRRTVLQLAGGMAAVGMGLALSTSYPTLILGGFLLTGLGVAVVAPLTFSLAGERVPGREGEASSLIASVAYLGLLLGPIVVGGLAEYVGLRLALATIVIVGVLISAVSSWALPKESRQEVVGVARLS